MIRLRQDRAAQGNQGTPGVLPQSRTRIRKAAARMTFRRESPGAGAGRSNQTRRGKTPIAPGWLCLTLKQLSSAEPSRLSCGPRTSQWQSPACGSSLFHPCRLFRNEEYPSSPGARRWPRSCSHPCCIYDVNFFFEAYILRSLEGKAKGGVVLGGSEGPKAPRPRGLARRRPLPCILQIHGARHRRFRRRLHRL